MPCSFNLFYLLQSLYKVKAHNKWNNIFTTALFESRPSLRGHHLLRCKDLQ